MHDRTVLLQGIVGSTAYGLANEDSDVDRLGIFAAPTRDILGLSPPPDSAVFTNPDITLHEIRKYLKLVLACNPTVTELLWLPEDLYEIWTPLGGELMALRRQLMHAKGVRNAYMGYATQQFKRLESRGDGAFSSDLRKRTAKHARHLARLVTQGYLLYATGLLQVRLDNPMWYIEFGDKVAAGDIDCARQLMSSYEEKFDNTASCLNSEPYTAAAERWLLKARWTYYNEE